MGQLVLIIAAFLGNTVFVASTTLQGLTNGQFYVISSASSAKVITAGLDTNFTRGVPVILTTWNDDVNQKWLALEAPRVIQITPTAREIQSPRYVLVPQLQAWDWDTVTLKGTKNITSTNDLPPFTEVLSLDGVTGNLTTDAFNQASSSQLWIPEDAGEGLISIRNLGNNQCIKNFDKAASLLQRIFSFIRRIRQHQKPHVPNPLSTFDCNVKDITEKWIAEL